MGKGKVQVEGVGRQNQRGAETRRMIGILTNRSRKKRKSVKDERSSHFLWGQSKLGREEKQRQEGPTISFHSSVSMCLAVRVIFIFFPDFAVFQVEIDLYMERHEC